jgi:hypothetical protein
MVENKDDPESITFDDWYALYCKKVGKPDAQRAWRKIDAVDYILVFERTILWNRVYREREWDHIPNPSTFLNQRRYADDLPPRFQGQGTAAHRPAKLPEIGKREPMSESARAMLAKIREKR